MLYSPESSTSVSLSLNHVICGGGFPDAVQETSMVSPILVVWFSRFPVIVGAMRSMHTHTKKIIGHLVISFEVVFISVNY